MTGPADLVAQVAARYDGEDNQAARLTASSLARLEWRRRRSGKTCDRCRQTRPIADYSRDSREPDGLRRYCRDCAAARYRSTRVNTD